jgi:hypothetical protein
MNKKKIIIALAIVVIAGGSFLFLKNKNQASKKQIDINPKEQKYTGPANKGNVSPITGVACDNWHRRTIAVMQPSDVPARPAAGFSEADMVIEMPAFTASVTRLMGVYGCNTPAEIGSLRSSRHDYIAIAKSLDSVFVSWGGSAFAHGLLNKGVIDNINELGGGGKAAPECFFRKEGFSRLEDSGYAKGEKLFECANKFNYRAETQFAGYPHQDEAAKDERPEGGHLRVAFAKPYDVEYDYDKETNTWLRTWADKQDFDRNNNKRLAPSNVVVMFAESEQIKLASDFSGLDDPWQYVTEEKEKQGLDFGGIGRYNNVQIGDPWFDKKDSGEAHYYMNGKEIIGTWKKDRKNADSKIFFYDQSGQEVAFVPGQIWVEILEPGQALKWVPTN